MGEALKMTENTVRALSEWVGLSRVNDIIRICDDWVTLCSALARVEAERDTALAQRDRLMAVLQDEQFSRVEMDRVIATVMTPEAAKEGTDDVPRTSR